MKKEISANREAWNRWATGTYTDPAAAVETTLYGWQHSLGEVVTALLDTGLEIRGLEEHDYSPHDCFPFTVETGPGRYGIRGLEDQVPLLFSIRARKPPDAS